MARLSMCSCTAPEVPIDKSIIPDKRGCVLTFPVWPSSVTSFSITIVIPDYKALVIMQRIIGTLIIVFRVNDCSDTFATRSGDMSFKVSIMTRAGL
jgi:hypothetical protein